jgi:adenylate cyclase
VNETAAGEGGAIGARRIWGVGLLTLGLLTAVIAVVPARDSWLQSYGFDAFQRLSPRKSALAPVMVVEIDDRSIASVGQWPWPRNRLAELIRAIERQEPRAIGVDILMAEDDRLSPQQLSSRALEQDPDLAARLAALPSNDTELAAAIGAGPVVLGLVGTTDATGRTLRAPPFAVFDASRTADHGSVVPRVGQYGGVIPSIDELDRAAAGHGLMSAAEHSGDVIRRVPLVASVKGTLMPALSVEMLRVALQAPALKLHVAGSAVRAVSAGNFTAPTEEDGAVRIHYAHRDPQRTLSAIDVIEGTADPQSMKDKLVVVGMGGLALTDYQNTPLGESMPGAEIHAQLLENLYEQSWLTRPAWAPALELVVFVLLGLLLIWATPRWKPRNAALLAVGSVVVPAIAAYVAFRSQRQLYDAATNGVALLVLFSTLLVLTLADATRRRKLLERVVQAQRVQAAYISGELEAAQRIQTGILPRSESLHDPRADLAAAMVPAREVGGDLYDFFPLDADRLFFMIGDVAGKGLSASMFMAISKSLYKSATLRRPDATISELMRIANDEVSRDNPEMFFVTVFAGILDLPSGALTYCNAGHENPYVLDPDRAAPLRLDDGAGPPLCTVERFAYSSGRRQMQPGELLCLFTDGVDDARNPEGERYGSERLRDALARLAARGATAQGIVDAVVADVRSFAGAAEPADDVTLLVVRWAGPNASS